MWLYLNRPYPTRKSGGWLLTNHFTSFTDEASTVPVRGSYHRDHLAVAVCALPFVRDSLASRRIPRASWSIASMTLAAGSIGYRAWRIFISLVLSEDLAVCRLIPSGWWSSTFTMTWRFTRHEESFSRSFSPSAKAFLMGYPRTKIS